MNDQSIANAYRDYIRCLNDQDWDSLHLYVHEDVEHNGRPLGLSGYRDMLVNDFQKIPDLRFSIETLVVDYPHIGARLVFDCSPIREFLGLNVNGRNISFHENVFYNFDENGKIVFVWSIIDRQAIKAQLN